MPASATGTLANYYNKWTKIITEVCIFVSDWQDMLPRRLGSVQQEAFHVPFLPLLQATEGLEEDEGTWEKYSFFPHFAVINSSLFVKFIIKTRNVWFVSEEAQCISPQSKWSGNWSPTTI